LIASSADRCQSNHTLPEKHRVTHEQSPTQTHRSFGACVVLGLLCNWLLCIAVWLAIAAQDAPGRIIGVW
jgi:formate/nitrite transporter FocA (FNT family)